MEDYPQRKIKGIWIPIEIWKNKTLSWNEKILLMEIDSCTTEFEDCYFSNKYIAELLGVTENFANKIVSSLIVKGYITKTGFDGRHRFVRTNIRVVTHEEDEVGLYGSTRQGCTKVQGSIAAECKAPIIRINKENKDEEEKEKDVYDKSYTKKKENHTPQSEGKVSTEKKTEKDTLFEDCWKAYKRKGSKKKSLEQWKKLTDEEKQSVMPHIRAYVSSRTSQYQKDFERYLRDRTFLDVVFTKNGNTLYDPSMFDVGVYSPRGHGIYYNETKKYYGFMDMYFDGDTIFDDYTDENRPDGATLVLNNARGIIKWNANTKKWEKQ